MFANYKVEVFLNDRGDIKHIATETKFANRQEAINFAKRKWESGYETAVYELYQTFEGEPSRNY